MRKLLCSTLAAVALTATVAGTAQAYWVQPVVPPLRVETVPVAPGPNYVWRPGYWNWGGRRYVWVGGSYVVRGPGYGRWAPGYWGPRHRWYGPRWVR